MGRLRSLPEGTFGRALARKLGFLQSLYASGKLPEFLSKRMWDAYFLGRESGFRAANLKPEMYWEMPVEKVKALYHGLS